MNVKGLLFGAVILFYLSSCQGLAVENSILLRYDDGVPEDGMWIDSSKGHAVLFTPPSSDWTLSKIAISGMLNPESDQDNIIVFEIWDEDLNLLYSRADNPKSYFGDEMAWAEIDVPDIRLSNDFYICLFEFSNIYVGSDLSNTSSGRSFMVSRNPNRIDNWNLHYPRNETDWSIVAVGVSVAPTVDFVLKPSEEAIIVEALITDPDGDLARASMQVIDNESLDVLWSEQRLLEGREAKVTFTWPVVFFQMTNGTGTLEPILAFNTIEVSPNEEPYMAYLAPCVLKLTPGGPDIDAAAYFGVDEEFHALIDTIGFTHYMSRELLGVVQPQESYGDYVKNNVTLIEGLASLSFYNLNLNKGMTSFPAILLTRSPVHHYKMKLNRKSTDTEGYFVILDAEDAAGNRVSLSKPKR